MPAQSKENRALFLEGKKRCSWCKEIKSLKEIKVRNHKKGQYSSTCKVCVNKYNSAYYAAHPEYMRSRSREYFKTWKWTRWQQVLDALGNSCKCCGEANPAFLTVDHINNDGYTERKLHSSGTKKNSRSSRALWAKIRLEGYPKDKYQILCFNCNCGRARMPDKICPHVRSLEMAVIQSPFKDRVVPATNKKIGQDIQKVGPADLTIGISLPGSTSQGMVTNLVKGK